MNDLALPAEWNLYYEGWIISDGEPHRSVGDVFDWFTLEFGSDGLAKTEEKSKSAIALADFGYQICAELIFLCEETCLLDFGLRVGGYHKIFGAAAGDRQTILFAGCKVGDYVTGTVSLGLPAIAHGPDELLKAYRWKVNRISADLTPYFADTGMLDPSRARYQEVESTKSVAAHGYFLHCSQVNSVS